MNFSSSFYNQMTKNIAVRMLDRKCPSMPNQMNYLFLLI